MTASFLGVTAHYYTHEDKRRHQVTLAVKRFPPPHTAQRVAEALNAVVSEWSIMNDKVFRVFTDNGSNMVAAFKERISNRQLDLDDEIDDETDLDDENGTEVIELTEDITVMKPTNDTDLDDSENDEADLDDDEDELEATANSEILEFCSKELEHSVVFVGWKRISCIIHTLQLVVKLFEINPVFRPTIKKAHRLVKRFNKSCKATEMLIKKSGRKLVSDCPTRWDSTFLMLSRLIDLKVHVNYVSNELSWETLSSNQWKQLDLILSLLQPFAHQTNIVGAEQSTSISMVIPVLKELQFHLEEVNTTYKTALHLNI